MEIIKSWDVDCLGEISKGMVIIYGEGVVLLGGKKINLLKQGL